MLIVINLQVPDMLSNASYIELIIIGIGVCVISKISIDSFLKKYSVRERHIFLNIFLISFIVSLLFLKFCWSPFLMPHSDQWGFDPQRYYLYAIQIVDQGYYVGWVGSGFNGVVYFYAILFRVFGYHPLIPLYLNSLLALVSSLMLFRIFENVKNLKPHYFALLLLIPELVYYNIMMSKDTLCQYGIVFVLYGFYRFYHERKIPLLIFLVFSFLFLLIIRPPYAIAVLVAISFFLLFCASRMKYSTKLVISLVLIVAVIGGLKYSNMLSSSDLKQEDISSRIEMTMAGGMSSADTGGSQIAAFLTPDNVPEVFIFGVIRSVIYLFPELYYSFFDTPSMYTFGALTQLVTGLIAPLFIFVVFCFIKEARKEKEHNSILLILFFVLLMFLVGFSTPNFIQQRYRITYEMLYFTLVILAYSKFRKRYFVNAVKKWTLVLTIFVVLFLIMRKL